MKKLKTVPKFKSEKEEANFWDTHDFTDYYDVSKMMVNPSFSNLKPSTRNITMRVSESMLRDLKMLANKRMFRTNHWLKLIVDRSIFYR